MEEGQRLIFEAAVNLSVKGRLPASDKIKAGVWKIQPEEAKRKNGHARPKRMSPITLARNIGPHATLTGGPWNPRHIDMPRMRSLNAKYLLVESTCSRVLRVPEAHVESLMRRPRRGQQKRLGGLPYRSHCRNMARFELLHANLVRAEKAIWNRAKERVKEQDLCKGSRTVMDYYFEERKLSYLWLKKAAEQDSKFSRVKCYTPGFRMIDPDGTVRIV